MAVASAPTIVASSNLVWCVAVFSGKAFLTFREITASSKGPQNCARLRRHLPI